MKRWAVGLTLLLGSAASGCSPEAPPVVHDQEEEVTAAIPSNIQRSGPALDAAFLAVFGGAAPKLVMIADDVEGYLDGERAFTPAALITSGTDTYLISEGYGVYRQFDCHACMGGMIVDKVSSDGSYQRLNRWFLNHSTGGFGGPPQWSVRTDLFDSPALLIEDGYTAQGCTSSGVTMYELTPDGLVQRTDTILTGAEQPDGVEASGTITPRERGRRFAVTYVGDGEMTATYVRSGQKFATTDDLANVPSC